MALSVISAEVKITLARPVLSFAFCIDITFVRKHMFAVHCYSSVINDLRHRFSGHVNVFTLHDC